MGADAPGAEKGGKLEAKRKVECKKWSEKAECKGRVQRQSAKRQRKR